MTSTIALSRPRATILDRAIIHRTAGQAHGPITRLVSPSDLGELIKPFVFLDLFDLPPGADSGTGFGWHPHSGIATVTVPIKGAAWCADSIGESGEVRTGGVEWMQAGGGVWHTGGPSKDEERSGLLGFQLWLALPEALENIEPESLCVTPEAVPTAGPARVILGNYGSAKSTIPPVADLTYLQVTLDAGEHWTFRPPSGHTVAWLAIAAGSLEVSGSRLEAGIAVFAPSEAEISVEAVEPTQFVLGSAAPHLHPLVLGHYSVHTSQAALARGEAGIRAVKARLDAEGRL